jgi:transcriptional regulator with XRE-family HTH domain
MAVDVQRIKSLLGDGLTTEVVARAVGCTSSYISQLMADEDFRTEVAEMRVRALAGHTERDKRIDSIEDRLLSKLEEVVPHMYKPADILRATVAVNAMKRRGATSNDQQNIMHTQVVNINLPPAAARQFVINQEGVVIEADKETLVTMPATQLMRKLAEEAAGTQKEKYATAGRFLRDAG